MRKTAGDAQLWLQISWVGGTTSLTAPSWMNKWSNIRGGSTDQMCPSSPVQHSWPSTCPLHASGYNPIQLPQAAYYMYPTIQQSNTFSSLRMMAWSDFFSCYVLELVTDSSPEWNSVLTTYLWNIKLQQLSKFPHYLYSRQMLWLQQEQQPPSSKQQGAMINLSDSSLFTERLLHGFNKIDNFQETTKAKGEEQNRVWLLT